MLLTFNLRRYKHSIVKNTKDITTKITPIIILQIYFPYQPLALSTNNKMPAASKIELPRAMAAVFIILGQH